MTTEILKLYQRSIKDGYTEIVHWIVEYHGYVYAVTSDLSMAKKVYEVLSKLK